MKMKQDPTVRAARDARQKVLNRFKNKGPETAAPAVKSTEDIKLSPAVGEGRTVRRETLAEQKARQRQEVAKGAPKGIDPALWKEVQSVETAARDLIEQHGIVDPRLVEVMRRFWGATETARRLGLETIEKGRRIPDRALVEQLSGAPHRQRPINAVLREMDDRYRFLLENPNGFMKLEALVAGTGLLAGGLYGATIDGDNAFDEAAYAISGALLGGALGYGGAKALKGHRFGKGGNKLKGVIGDPKAAAEALDTANMLASPAAIKASLGSMSAAAIGIMERIAEGNMPAARAMIKASRQAPNIYWKALTAPSHQATGAYTARIVHGMGGQGLPQKILGFVTRPFAAADQAGSHILKAGGYSAREADRMMLMGEPTSWQGQFLLKFINDNMAYRMLAKFPRVRIAQFERGMEYLPGVPQKHSPRSSKAPRWLRGFEQQEGLSNKAWRAKKKIGAGIMLAGTAYGYWRDPSLYEMGFASAGAGPAALPMSISMAAGKALRHGKDPITEAIVQAGTSVPQINEADLRRWKERGVILGSARNFWERITGEGQ